MAIGIHENWTAQKHSTAAAPTPAEPRDPAFAAALATLTTRQYSILRARCEGFTGPEIGKRLYCSDQTVKNHLSAVFRKLGIDAGRKGCGRGHGKGSARACYLLGRYDADVDREERRLIVVQSRRTAYGEAV